MICFLIFHIFFAHESGVDVRIWTFLPRRTGYGEALRLNAEQKSKVLPEQMRDE